MPIAAKFDEEELLFGMLLQDPYLFALLFWADDLYLPCSIEQKVLLTDSSRRQLWCTGRKILKTLSLERDVLHSIVMNYLGPSGSLREAMFVTPRDSHLVPTRDRIFSKINNVPFFSGMIREKNKSGGGSGVIESINGFKWHFRIEGVSGTDENMAGIRACKILGDELAYGNQVCHQSRLMTAFPDAEWKYCGVPNGVRDSPFFDLDTKPDMRKGWSSHKYPTFINPRYSSPEMLEQLKADYGGEGTQGYITQVLGQWGEEAFSSFPPGSVAVDNSAPLLVKELNEKQAMDLVDGRVRTLFLPFDPDAQYVIGLDFGYSPDPTEIIVSSSKDGKTWRQSARLRLVRVKLPNQTRFLDWLVNVGLNSRVSKISTDNVSLLQSMTDTTTFGIRYTSIMRYANPGGSTVLTDVQGKAMLDDDEREVKRRNKQFLTDSLKEVFHNTILNTGYPRKLWLAPDTFLLESLYGLTERKTPAGMTVYECSKPDEEHPKDALIYMLDAIIDATRSEIAGADWSELAKAIGWVGRSKGEWTSPWANASSGQAFEEASL